MQDGKLEWSTSYYTVHYLKYRSQCDIRELLQKLREYWLPFTHQSDVRSGWRIFESGFVRADAASDRECHRESECHVLDCSIRSLRSGIKDPWKCDTRQNPILGTGCLLTKSECFSGWLSLIAHFCMFRDLLFFKSHSLVPVRCRV